MKHVGEHIRNGNGKSQPNGRRINGSSWNVPEANGTARKAPVRMVFSGEGMKVEVASMVSAQRGDLELRVLLQTFLTSLTWLCSSGSASPTGWLEVTLRQRRAVCRVEHRPADNTNVWLVPMTRQMPVPLQRAIASVALGGRQRRASKANQTSLCAG